MTKSKNWAKLKSFIILFNINGNIKTIKFLIFKARVAFIQFK